MGSEVEASLMWKGVASTRRADLGSDHVIFAGRPRVIVRYGSFTGVVNDAGRVTVTFPDGEATFDIGKAADRWAAKMRAPPTILDKLGIGAGDAIGLEGVKDADFEALLRARNVDVHRVAAKGLESVLLVGITSRAALRRLDGARANLAPDGALWVVYPKGGDTVSEDEIRASLREAGLVDVKVARFSDTHTALKWVVPKRAR